MSSYETLLVSSKKDTVIMVTRTLNYARNSENREGAGEIFERNII